MIISMLQEAPEFMVSSVEDSMRETQNYFVRQRISSDELTTITPYTSALFSLF